MQAKWHGARQKVRRRSSKEIGKKVCKRSSKELDNNECKKSSK